MGQVIAECIAAETADSVNYPGMSAVVALWKDSVVVERSFEGVAVAVAAAAAAAAGRNFVVVAADIWTDEVVH